MQKSLKNPELKGRDVDHSVWEFNLCTKVYPVMRFIEFSAISLRISKKSFVDNYRRSNKKIMPEKVCCEHKEGKCI